MSTSEAAPNSAAKLQLEVIGGLHSGVSLPLANGDHVIGSKAEADIVLRDDGVTPQHVVICVEGGAIRVEAIGGPIQAGDESIDNGQGCRLRLPIELHVGAATLRLFRIEGHAGIGHLIGLPIWLTDTRAIKAASGAGCVVIALLMWQSLSTTPEPIATPFTFSTSPEQPTKQPDPTVQIESAANGIEQRLRDVNIKTLKVTAGKRHITVSGSLPVSRKAAWAKILRWFDDTYASKLTLIANVVSQPQPALRLQAIWYGERPYIIAENGSRYYEGAVLDGGWQLQQIGQDGLTLKKGEAMMAISYR